MARLKLAGFGREGYVQDVAEYDAVPEAFNEVRNVRFNSIGAVAFSGHRSVLAPAPINPLWLRVFPPVDFPRWVYANQESVYVFDDGHIDISRPGGYNGILTERWQGEVFSGVGVFNNTIDVPQMWPAFNSASQLQDLANWPANLRCKFLRPFKVYLIAGFLTEGSTDHPFRVRWSHPADPGTVPESWAVNNPAYDSGEMELSETDDYIVDGRTLGEFFMVYKQKTAHAMYLSGNSRVFGQRTVISGKGALTRDCVQDIKGGHFVAGLDDIYVHTGQKGSEESLVEAKLRSWIYNQIDASNFFNCYTVDYRAANEIWFCFPEAGETYPTLAFVWNKVTGGRGVRDIQQSPFMWSGPVDERSVDGDIWGGDELEAPTLTNHEVIAYGDVGSGAQEPRINFGFGGALDIPEGAFWIYGGGSSAALTVDGNSAASNAMPYGYFREIMTGEWWGNITPVNLADWEIRCTVLSGNPPDSGAAVNTWLPLEDEPTWTYGAVVSLPQNGVLRIELREAVSETVRATADMTWSQELFVVEGLLAAEFAMDGAQTAIGFAYNDSGNTWVDLGLVFQSYIEGTLLEWSTIETTGAGSVTPGHITLPPSYELAFAADITGIGFVLAVLLPGADPIPADSLISFGINGQTYNTASADTTEGYYTGFGYTIRFWHWTTEAGLVDGVVYPVTVDLGP